MRACFRVAILAAVLATSLIVVSCGAADNSPDATLASDKGNKSIQVEAEFWHVEVEGHLFAISEEGPVYCGPNNGDVEVDRFQGCVPFEGTAPVTPPAMDEIRARYARGIQDYNESEYGKVQGALTLQPGITGKNCFGPAGPLGSSWCGDVEVENAAGQLVAYDDKWDVVGHLTLDGDCLLVPVADPCPASHKCLLDMGAKTAAAFAVCEEIVDCKLDVDCAGGLHCSPSNVCVACFQDSHCTDATACTTDTCKPDATCGHTNVNCLDADQCTLDSCDPATGCKHTFQTGAACTDGNACTGGDTCTGNACTGAALTCDDGKSCTDVDCDPATGCKYTALVSQACDDANACTSQDACKADGTCKGETVVNCDDQKPCTADTCTATGGCAHADLANGTSCQQSGTAGVCFKSATVALTCETNFCTFTQAEIDATPAGKVPTKYSCPTQFEGGVEYQKFVGCMLITGTMVGVWQELDNCGPTTSPVKCVEPNGCEVYAPGYQGCKLDSECPSGWLCNTQDKCVPAQCTPSCTGKTCGDSNGCGGTCGTTCAAGKVCKTADFSCVACLTAAQCDDANAATTDACTASNTCSHVCTPACTGKQCGADGCGGTCGTCAAGQSCNASQQCVANPPQCLTAADCAAGQFCGNGACYTNVDQKGKLSPGGGAGTDDVGDGTPDNWDNDKDCHCESLPCYGTDAAVGACPQLFGGDCDDTASGKENHPGATDWPDGFDNACLGKNADGTPKFK